MVFSNIFNRPHNASSLQKRFRFARYGLNFLTVYWVLRFFLRPDGINAENILTSLFLVSAFIAFYLQISLGFRRKDAVFPFYGVTRLLVYFLFIICVVAFARGLTFDLSRLMTLFVNPVVGGTVWLLPMAILIGTQKGVVESLMPTFRHHAMAGFIFSIIGFILLSLGYEDSMFMASASSAHMLLYAAPFVLLAGLGNRKYRRIFVFGLVSMMFLHLQLVSRTSFVVSLLVLVFVFSVGNTRSASRIFFRTVAAACIALPFLIIAFDYMASIVPGVWLVDTRSFLFEELRADFSLVDVIFGRGALGGYYSPYFYELIKSGIEGGDSFYRQVVESGYLHILLKAGILGIVATVAMMLRAVILAKKFSDARIGVGVMAFLSLQLVVMTVGLHLSFDPFHILTWLVVGLALAQPRRQSQLGV